MARGLSYRDAAVLLGGGPETTVVAALDKLCGGALLVATAGGSGFALSLFDAKAELFKLCTDLVGGLGERIRGLSRYDRTRRLEAANAVAAMAAFFKCMNQVHLPRELDPSKPEQLALATGQAYEGNLVRHMMATPPPVPAPHLAHELFVAELATYYDSLTHQLLSFLRGLEGWSQLSKAQFDPLDVALKNVAPRAVAKYEEMFRRLALEFPEFGYWATMLDHQATRAEIRRMDVALAGMASALADLRIGSAPSRARQELAQHYQAVLRHAGLAFEDLRVPANERCYVTPNFRVGQPRPDEVTRTDWWDGRPVRTDLEDFLIGHLTSPMAVEAPLVVLGHPGAGKSLLTEMLAARLPASDFLTVRVPLRDLPSDADLQTQLELAVRMATGRTVSWPELTADAGDAMPVVLLDGFDELLQATGQSQSNYLERITAFQLREAELGRPVAVLVTSRLTVADRARPVFGAVTLLLEPFDDHQIGLWLDAWNACNAAALAARDLRPLTPETALRYRELACQPLLLLLLALYDSDGNALHNEETLNEAELYERLLTGFTRREILKSSETLTETQVDELVAREMLHLSVVAFAMFNRNQLWVTEAQLDADLRVLLGESPAADTHLTAAELLVGRFYFVHVAQAVHDQKRLKTYEFLHATFGEFLVARLVVQELRNLLAAASVSALWSRPRHVDDQFLHAVLSFAPLTMRRSVLSFLNDMIGNDRRLPDLLLGLFRTSMQARDHTPLDEYRPARLSVPGRVAIYSANLFMLLAIAAEEITSQQLFPDADSAPIEWTRAAQLWHSQLPSEGWRTLITSIAVNREWDGDQRLIRLHTLPLVGEFVFDYPDFDPNWTYDNPPEQWQGWHAFIHDDDWFMRVEASLTGGRLHEVAMHNLAPFDLRLGTMLTTFHDMHGAGMVSAARALIELWLASGQKLSLVPAYDTCLRIAVNGFAPDDLHTRELFRELVVQQLTNDQGSLPPGWLRETLAAIESEKMSDHMGGQEFLERLRETFDLD